MSLHTEIAPRRQRRLLVAALAATAITFVASTMYSQHSASAIDDEAASIMADATPSIDRLYEARAGLLGMQSALLRYVESAHRPGGLTPLGSVSAARAQLEESLAKYVQLHAAQPAHVAMYREEVGKPLEALSAAVDRVIADVSNGDEAGAQREVQREVQPLIGVTWSGMWRLVEWNNRDVRARVVSIVVARHHGTTLAFALDALSAAFVVVMGLLALRTMRADAASIAKREKALEERADAFEQFATRVAHDIASPLGAVLLNVDVLDRMTPPSSAGGAAVTRAKRAIARCCTLIDGLLAFARSGAHGEPGVQTPVDDVLREVADQLGQSEADFAIAIDPFAPCDVACSRGVLSSIVTNLLENAAKYTRGCPVRHARVRVRAERAMVHVEVEDTGPGIDSVPTSTLFEPYVRAPAARQSGIGLGLATVKRLCEGHGGRVGVRTAPGAGSMFWFELPRAGGAVDARARETS